MSFTILLLMTSLPKLWIIRLANSSPQKCKVVDLFMISDFPGPDQMFLFYSMFLGSNQCNIVMALVEDLVFAESWSSGSDLLFFLNL